MWQLFEGTGQLIRVQQVVAGCLQQGDAGQRVLHAGELRAFVGGDLLQGQHQVQAELADQPGDHLLWCARQNQQVRAALAQRAIQRHQTLEEKARTVHAEPAGAEGASLQMRRSEDEHRQQALGIQSGLQGRVIVEAQILFEPQQCAHGGFLERRSGKMAGSQVMAQRVCNCRRFASRRRFADRLRGCENIERRSGRLQATAVGESFFTSSHAYYNIRLSRPVEECYMDIFGIAVLIFLVTDPFGNIAIFIAALKNVAPKRRLWIAGRELLCALALLLLFLTFGDKVLSALGLSREATAIAGGIILFVIAMRLIFPGPQGVLGDVPDGETMLVPLATPAVAGPSALAVLMTLRNTHEGPLWELYLAVILAWAATAFILLQASFLQRFLGPRGLTAVERLMGMLLIMLSVDMLLDNLQSVLHIRP